MGQLDGYPLHVPVLLLLLPIPPTLCFTDATASTLSSSCCCCSWVLPMHGLGHVTSAAGWYDSRMAAILTVLLASLLASLLLVEMRSMK